MKKEYQINEPSKVEDQIHENQHDNEDKITEKTIVKTEVLSAEMGKSLIELLEKKMKRVEDMPASFTIIDPSEEKAKKKESEKKEEISFELPFIHQSLIPKDLNHYLDRFVIGQKEAKKRLSIAVCDHLNYIKNRHARPHERSSYIKQNILMYGPTGVGKTFLIQCIADYAGIPFVKSDATKFTESGYMGSDVEETVRLLYDKAKSNRALAAMGIIFIDEIDKIAAEQSHSGRDVGGKGVQNSLLKLLDESDVNLKPPWDMQSQIKAMMGGAGKEDDTLNTKDILFIGSGVFQPLREIAAKNRYGNRYGFMGQKRDHQTIRIEPDDFVDAGFEREFVGRFPVQIPVQNLTKSELFDILKYSESSILNHVKETFSYYQIQLDITNDALEEIADIAHGIQLGARSLSVILDRTLTHLKYEGGPHYLKIDRAYIQNEMNKRPL